MNTPSRQLLKLAGISLCCMANLAAQAQTATQTPTPAAPVSKLNVPAVTSGVVTPYWTPERYKSARPLPLKLLPPGAQAHRDSAPASGRGAAAVGVDGQAPSLNPAPSARQLFTPDPADAAAAKGAGAAAMLGGMPVTPQAVGSFGAYYTSTRVFPLYTGAAAAYSADRVYPYRAVGILFFSIQGSAYLCSASVIQRRVVATAGHCVYSPDEGGFHSDFVFIPAYRDGNAPYLEWHWRYVTVTADWVNGGGWVPNPADYAMIEFADQPMTAGTPAVKLGNVTGWLGWQTQSLEQNHTSKLGYPCNLDYCSVMQNVTSSSYQDTDPNNVEYGSDARGGSSGGPWVQNFQTLADGGGTGMNEGSNRVVGVTSYGYVEEEPKVQGASIPDSRWVALWTKICARAGNCN